MSRKKPSFRINERSLGIDTYQNFKHLSQVVLKMKIFFFNIFLCIFVLYIRDPWAKGHFGQWDLHLNTAEHLISAVSNFRG